MANLLEKILSTDVKGMIGRNLPAHRLQTGKQPSGSLPNASVIYGVAASALFVIALYFMLITHAWITGFLVMLPAGCFLGFALHFLKHPH